MSTSSIDPDSVLYIRDSVTSSEVYLIGTAHISDKSADDVADLIELVRPDFVFLELCPKREQKLREMMGKSSAAEEHSSEQEPGKNKGNEGASASFLDDFLAAAGVQKWSGAGGVASTLRGAFQRLLPAQQNKVQPGGEFRTAIAKADSLKIPIISGDRDQEETMRLLRQAMWNTNWWTVLTTRPPEEIQRVGCSTGLFLLQMQKDGTRKVHESLTLLVPSQVLPQGSEGQPTFRTEPWGRTTMIR